MAMWQWWTRYQIKERYALNQIRLDNQMRSINSIKALNNISHSHLEHSVFYVILCYGCEFMYLSISIIKSILVRVHNAFIYINSICIRHFTHLNEWRLIYAISDLYFKCFYSVELLMRKYQKHDYFILSHVQQLFYLVCHIAATILLS